MLSNAAKKRSDKVHASPQLTRFERKLRKLKNNPSAFFKDSFVVKKTGKGLQFTYAKLGMYFLVLVISLGVISYYAFVASSRYTSQSQFVVKQAGGGELQLSGLAALGSVSPSLKDSLVLKRFIESREMAVALDESIGLKAHYQNSGWDVISRLGSDASVEEYVDYYRKHIAIHHDEVSEILDVEVQAFNAEYANKAAMRVLAISEAFINRLGRKMADAQLVFAEENVERAYRGLKRSQGELVLFQNVNRLFSPEQKSTSLLAAISSLESEIIGQDADLKSLLAFMRSDAPEVEAKKIRVKALKDQLVEEKKKLVSRDESESIHKINADYQEIKLGAELASSLYASSLSSLELQRAEAYRKIIHLLIIEHPSLAEDSKYPRRLYSILTWFVVLTMIYLLGRLIVTIIKEHRE